MKLWRMIEKSIDFIAECFGRIGWALILYCMFFGVSDVFLRYVLNSPSLWISTTVQVAMVMIACVGGVYALNDNAFVKLDLFYANFSAKKKSFLRHNYSRLYFDVFICINLEGICGCYAIR